MYVYAYEVYICSSQQKIAPTKNSIVVWENQDHLVYYGRGWVDLEITCIAYLDIVGKGEWNAMMCGVKYA